jgi:hypothetical protein
MEKRVYVIYSKSSEGKTISINAAGHTVSSDGQRVTFQDANNTVAVFNMSEIVGFVQADHIVS